MIKVFLIPYYIFRYSRDIIFCNLKLGKWDSSWRLHSLPIIQKCKSSEIEIGIGFVACSNPKNNSIGVFQKVILKTCRSGAVIRIGDNVGISGAVISSMESVHIGNNVLIGSGVLITDNDAHAIHPDHRNDTRQILIAPIEIKDNAFIGARAIILKGVVIGEGAIVGAGAVVTRNVPEYAIVAGNPAKTVGDVRDTKYIIG